MSNLARIRHIPTPAPEPGSVDADIVLLIEACRSMDRRDELIRSLRARGLSVKRLVEITEQAVPGRGVKHQRIYQILQSTNGHEPRAVEDAQNGNGSTGDTGG